MKNSIVAALAALILAAICSMVGAQEAEKVTLRHNPQKGAKFWLESQSRQNLVYEVPDTGKKMRNGENVGSFWEFEVIATEDDATTYKVTLLRYQQIMLADMQSGKYDSSFPDADENPNKNINHYVVDKSFRLKIDRSGAISEIDASDLRGEVVPELYRPAELTDEDLKDYVEISLKDEMFRGKMEPFFIPFPEHALGVGDKWVSDEVSESGMPFAITTEYEVKSLEDGTISIGYVSSILPDPTRSEYDHNGTLIEHNYEGEQHGTYKFLTKSGILAGLNFSQEVAGYTFATDKDGVETPLQQPVEITSDTRVMYSTTMPEIIPERVKIEMERRAKLEAEKAAGK